MIQTLEATIDEKGTVSLLKPLRLPVRHRALVTILEEEPDLDGDLAPATTHTQMAAAHRSRNERLAVGASDYTSIDLPFVEDGADW